MQEEHQKGQRSGIFSVGSHLREKDPDVSSYGFIFVILEIRDYFDSDTALFFPCQGFPGVGSPSVWTIGDIGEDSGSCEMVNWFDKADGELVFSRSVLCYKAIKG
ncbi:hypothetical protein AVEN_222980-1 [Araneus ventricosus]|uniref:Uncharacterized protein n=1 Tax=Araneus ventricosus TaxID=182803 RepID=A0A4Y2K7Z5_ARAVE|nr:hypothetical protein AVEN_222980-1 [Araneus ventricosus]